MAVGSELFKKTKTTSWKEPIRKEKVLNTKKSKCFRIRIIFIVPILCSYVITQGLITGVNATHTGAIAEMCPAQTVFFKTSEVESRHWTGRRKRHHGSQNECQAVSHVFVRSASQGWRMTWAQMQTRQWLVLRVLRMALSIPHIHL